MHRPAREQGTRFSVLSATLQICLVLLALRLVLIQVVHHRWWARHAASAEHRTIALAPQRGLILDRRGRKLAVTVKRWSVFANPRAIPPSQRRAIAQRLALHLDLSTNDVLKQLRRVRTRTPAADGRSFALPNYFVWIQRKAPRQKAVTVLCDRLPGGKRLPGVGLRAEHMRQYPNGTMLCHVLGFVGMDGEGLDGLEAYFDRLLAGTAGRKLVQRDGLGRNIAGSEATTIPVKHGRSLVLTIDSRVQRIVEEELADACAKHKPESACAVVMDPWNGDILSLANWPVFSPVRFSEAPQNVRRNMAAEACLEPGSTSKPFIVAAAIEHGVVTPETRFNCHHGQWRTQGRVLHDAHGYGILTVRDIVAFSSNIGMAQVGMRLGPQAMYDALCRFGFGQPTGVRLPGESSGILRPPCHWSRLSITSLSIGQEIACSPLQLVTAFCVFANGGWYVPPRLVLALADTDGRSILRRAPSPTRRRVLSAQTAQLMCRDILAGVVTRGTAKRCALSGYRMAGKTGTAQIASREGGGYEAGAYVSAFVGIVPADDPRFVLGVIVKKPTGGAYYGSAVAAPVVARMAERILSMHHVPRLVTLPPGQTPLREQVRPRGT